MQNAGTTPWHRNTSEKTRKDRTGGGAVRSNLAHPPDRSSEAIDKTKSRIFPSSPEFCSTVRMSSSPRRLDMSAIMRYSLQCKRAPRNGERYLPTLTNFPCKWSTSRNGVISLKNFEVTNFVCKTKKCDGTCAFPLLRM